jgi:hypothetical protein
MKQVLSIDFHMLGNCFASSGMDNTVKIWSLEGRGSSSSSGGGGGGKIAQNIAKSFSYSTALNGAGGGTKQANDREFKHGVLSQLLPPGHLSSSSSSSTTISVDEQTMYKGPIHEQFPLYSSNQLHSDYVDCVRWLGNILLSKSTNNKIIMWKPAADDSIIFKASSSDIGAGSSCSDGGSSSSSSSSSSGGHGDIHQEDMADSPTKSINSSATAATNESGGATVLREFSFNDADIW